MLKPQRHLRLHAENPAPRGFSFLHQTSSQHNTTTRHLTPLGADDNTFKMEARCQCGSVSFTTPLPQPLALYICHCSECRRQTSSAFGTSAIFPKFELPETELLSCYRWVGVST